MDKTRRVVIATPLKGDIPSSYFKSNLQLASSTIPGVKLDWMLLEGPVVQMARNELVAHARNGGFDEIIFWDKDVLLEQRGENVTAAAILRLLSHDVDIVCAPYSSRHLSTHWHVHSIAGKKPNESGLQEVSRACIGFSKIKIGVFEKLEELNPDSKAVLIDPNYPAKSCTEFFPLGLQGKNRPAHRIAQIRALLADKELSASAKLQRIEREANIVHDDPNMFVGEDYWFCDLAREAGFTIWLDAGMMMGHTGQTTIPIPTSKLFDLMKEPWRQEEIKALTGTRAD